MSKEKKDIKVQIRITSAEKELLNKLLEKDKNLNISEIFRSSIYDNCKKYGINTDDSIGTFVIR